MDFVFRFESPRGLNAKISLVVDGKAALDSEIRNEVRKQRIPKEPSTISMLL